MVRTTCGVQLKDRKESTDFMFMVGLNETIDQFAMANSVRWNDHDLRRDDGPVWRSALHLEFKSQGMKERPKRTLGRQV